MSKIYELDISLFDKVKEINSYDNFIFTNRHTRHVVVVDNSHGEFFTEDFSNRLKGLIYLTNNTFLPPDVEKEYSENFDNYTFEKYEKVVSDSYDYYMDKSLDDLDFLKFNPKKKYLFSINTLDGERQFQSTIKDALGLASNYSSDLVHNGITIISPLRFDCGKNSELIEKCVGRENLSKSDSFDFGWFLPYRDFKDTCIEELTSQKNIKI